MELNRTAHKQILQEVMPGSPGPEVLGLTYSIRLAPHALQSLQGALGLECHLRSQAWGEGEGKLYLLIPRKGETARGQGQLGKAAPHGAELCPDCPSQILDLFSSSLEPMEEKEGKKQTSLH